jgi:hypothetical protein
MISRRILAAFALLCAVTPVYAQKTKAALTTEINTNWPDQTIGTITPALLRSTVLDIVNSYYDLNGGTSLACAAHQWVAGLPTLSSLTCTQPAISDLQAIGANTVVGSIAGGAPIALTQTQLGGLISASDIASGTLNTARLPSPFTNGTASGNTSKFATTTGSLTNGDCVKIDASGNFVDAGESCVGTIFVLPSDYGIVCDGVTNVTTAFQTMVTASSGKTIFIPAGPPCVINAHINLVSNIAIIGGGRDVSGIKMTGQDYIFNITNIDDVTIKDLYLLGTDSYTTWAVSTFGAVYMSMSASHSNFTFQNLKLSAFNASYWVYGTNSVGTVSNTTFDNIEVNTTVADVPTDVTTTNNTNYAIALFSGTAGVRWENTTIKNSQFNGSALCFHVMLFSDHYKYNIINNQMLNPGNPNTGTHCTNGLGATNAYGIGVYDLNSDGNPPTNGIISGNYILGPAASGIYFVGDGASFLRAHNSNQSTISNNLVVNQTNTDTLLPRGGIVANLSTDLSIVGNTLYGNAVGINVASQNAGEVSVLSNHCESGAGSSVCLSLTAGSNGSSNTDIRNVSGNYLNGLSSSISCASATSERFYVLGFSGNTILANSTGVNCANQFASFAFGLTNNSFFGGGTLASISGLTGTLSIFGNSNLSFTAATLPAANNGSSVFVSDGTPATACTGAGTGSTAFRQNSAWKCF